MNAATKMAPAGYTWCGKKGDLDLYLTHIRFPGENSDQPALYIRNENRRLDKTDVVTGQAVTGCPAFLVPYRDFWMFRPEDRDRIQGAGLGEMLQCLQNGCVALYGLDVPQYRHRIHDAILEFADDVKNLRPPPGLDANAWREQLERAGIHLRVNGEKVM